MTRLRKNKRLVLRKRQKLRKDLVHAAGCVFKRRFLAWEIREMVREARIYDVAVPRSFLALKERPE